MLLKILKVVKTSLCTEISRLNIKSHQQTQRVQSTDAFPTGRSAQVRLR